MVSTEQELITQIAAQPMVSGIVRYGSRSIGAREQGGDLDLFVLVDDRPPEVESIHFYIGEVPVDLNIRTWQDLEQTPPFTTIDYAITQGEVLFDRDGDLEARLGTLTSQPSSPAPLSAHDIAFIRFGHQHSMNKIQGRLEHEPVLCRFLLEANLFWLVQNYFLVRGLAFHGERSALRYLEHHEPTIWEHILHFYATADLHERQACALALGEQILAPIGGLWKQNEVLVFGTGADDLQDIGQHYLRLLLHESDR